MSQGIRSAFDRRMLHTDTLFTIEPLFLLVVAGVVVGIAIQAVIVAALVCSMVSAMWPHRPESWLHRTAHHGLVWFGGRGGAHVHVHALH